MHGFTLRIQKSAPLALAAISALASMPALADITVAPPAGGRVVVGSNQVITFGLNNPDADTFINATVNPSRPFSYLGTNNVPQNAASGATLSTLFTGGTAATVSSTGILPGVAGDLVPVSLSVTPTDVGGTPTGSAVIGTANYRLLQNRTLTGSASFGSGGRYMLSQAPEITFSIAGGAQTDDQATRVSSALNATASVNGFTITNKSGAFAYNGASQTHTFAVKRTVPGSYSLSNYALPSTNKQTVVLSAPQAPVTKAFYDAGANKQYYYTPTYSANGFGYTSVPGSALFVGEDVQGSDFDLSGVTISGSGTAVLNRSIAGQAVSLGRFMQNGPATSTSASNLGLNLFSTYDDTEYTRLRVNAFSVSTGNLTVSLASSVNYDSYKIDSSVKVNGTVVLDKSTIGTHYQNFDGANKVVSLENLPGETPQTGLHLQTYYNILQNNTAVASTVNVYAFNDANVAGYALVNQSAGRGFATDTHTAIDVSQYFYLTNGTSSAITITKANGQIVGEGLAGEVVQSSLTYQANIVRVNHFQNIGTVDGGKVIDGGSLEVKNATGTNRATQHIEVVKSDLSGQFNLFKLNGVQLTKDPEAILPSANVSPGQTVAWPVSVNSNLLPTLPPGSLGLTFRAYVKTLSQDAGFGGSTTNAAYGYGPGTQDGGYLMGQGKTEYRTITLEHVIPGTATDAGGTAPIAQGSDLGQQGITLSSTRSSTASLIDSLTLDAGTTLSLGFTNPVDADPAKKAANGFTKLASDIVSIHGLDHVLHVAELSYDPLANDGYGASEIGWYSAAKGAWVNAVLGNYNITNLDLVNYQVTVLGGGTFDITEYLNSHRYNYMSYGEYLQIVGGTPKIGDFGWDTAHNKVWAVIDHNSDFASLPEPASLGLIGLAGMGLLRRRRA